MPVGVVLDLCDRLLGEIGRRLHRFSWLRPLGGAIDDCLICDAYYPSNRLVVICREEGSEPDALYAKEVPRNGLLLLVVTPAELGMDRLAASEALVEQIGALRPLPERPGGAARSAAKRASSPRVPAREHEQRFGMLIGLALVIVLAAESLILVVLLALGNDHPVLAFGFALDACARALGTVAAARQGDHAHAWSCILIGSPGVLQYVLLGPNGAVEIEPGPLAGVVSVLAIGIVTVALLGSLIGI
jgi:hypothetical protein